MRIYPQTPGSVSLTRMAVPEDIDALVEMSMHFQGEVFARHLSATPATFRRLAENLLRNPNSVVYVDVRDGALVGMIAASLFTQPMSGDLWAGELCWWLEPYVRGGRAGLKLLRRAEAWAKEQGAVVFQMSAPTVEVSHFYEVLGYEQIETIHVRRL